MKKTFVKFVGALPLSCMDSFISTMGKCHYGRIAYSGGKTFYTTAFSGFESVFYEIEKQTGYSFLVRNNDINMNEKVSIDVKNKSVEEVLEMLFVGKNIRYKVEGEHISVYKPQQSRQNAITGIGLWMWQKNQFIGASVVVMGSTNGCITDFDGKFSLEVSEFPVKLQISYIGYKISRGNCT